MRRRSDVFVETKVWISDYSYDATLHAFDKSAAKLAVQQIDLLILHEPMPTAFDRTVAAYKALETLLAGCSVRAIGVSNFMPDHLDRLLAEVSVMPAVNQVEVHPYFRQTALLEKDTRHGVVSQAWSPIGGITFYPGWGGENRRSTLNDPVLLLLGERHGKTAARVMLRWHLEQDRSAIPKSVNAARIAENFNIFDFELSNDELAALDALDSGVRGGPDPESITLEQHGFAIPEA